MKDFFEEFFYMCSKNNTKSRGTYIMLAVTLVVLLSGFIAGAVAEVVYISADNFQLMPCLISVGCLVAFIGLIIWLKKS